MILTVAGKEKVTGASEVLNALADDAGMTEAVRPADTTDDAPMTEAEFKALDDLEAGIKGCWWRMGRLFAEVKARKFYRRKRRDSADVGGVLQDRPRPHQAAGGHHHPGCRGPGDAENGNKCFRSAGDGFPGGGVGRA